MSKRGVFKPPIIECWCGAVGTAQELFDPHGVDWEPCGGSGTLSCYCGGDQCVCHFHGSAECPGCEDCCEGYDEFDGSPCDDDEDYPSDDDLYGDLEE